MGDILKFTVVFITAFALLFGKHGMLTATIKDNIPVAVAEEQLNKKTRDTKLIHSQLKVDITDTTKEPKRKTIGVQNSLIPTGKPVGLETTHSE